MQSAKVELCNLPDAKLELEAAPILLFIHIHVLIISLIGIFLYGVRKGRVGGSVRIMFSYSCPSASPYNSMSANIIVAEIETIRDSNCDN